jgi:hypothetical protein
VGETASNNEMYIYIYKKKKLSALGACVGKSSHLDQRKGTRFTCYTGTKVQVQRDALTWMECSERFFVLSAQIFLIFFEKSADDTLPTARHWTRASLVALLVHQNIY